MDGYCHSATAAEDHQKKNALALVDKEAALFIENNKAIDQLGDAMINLMKDESLKSKLSINLRKLAITNADERIVDEIIKWTKEQVDLSESPLYSRDSKVESLLVSSNQSAPKYWLIFFKQR